KSTILLNGESGFFELRSILPHLKLSQIAVLLIVVVVLAVFGCQFSKVGALLQFSIDPVNHLFGGIFSPPLWFPDQYMGYFYSTRVRFSSVDLDQVIPQMRSDRAGNFSHGSGIHRSFQIIHSIGQLSPAKSKVTVIVQNRTILRIFSGYHRKLLAVFELFSGILQSL